MEEPTVSVRELNLETPDQSTDGLERKTTKPTPMPNAEEQENKTIEFSPIDIVDDPTSNTPEMIKDESQTKKNVVNRDDCSDGRDETKRERGCNADDREIKNFWNNFRNYNRGQPRQRAGHTWSKLGALLRNSLAQDKLVVEKPSGTRVV